MTLFFFVAGFFARMMFHRKGARGFWRDRSKRILVPLVVGWVILAPTLLALWMWGLTKTFGTLPPAPANMPPPPPGAFPLTHLWFLYYLLVLYILLLLGRAVLTAVDRRGALRRAGDALVRSLAHTGAAAVVLPVPLVASLYVRPDWVMWFGIPTPDQSVIPQVASLVGYGTAITLGWLVHRQPDVLAIWGRQWRVHLAGAVTATAACLWVAGIAPAFVPQGPGVEKFAFAVAYGVAIWFWSFAVIGLAMRYMARENEKVRYVADASYWIYLAHLPVVVSLQVLVGHLPWHWSVKFPLVLIISFVVLFASYRYLVRATFIGWTLNGRKYPRIALPSFSHDDPAAAAAPVANIERDQIVARAPMPLQ